MIRATHAHKRCEIIIHSIMRTTGYIGLDDSARRSQTNNRVHWKHDEAFRSDWVRLSALCSTFNYHMLRTVCGKLSTIVYERCASVYEFHADLQSTTTTATTTAEYQPSGTVNSGRMERTHSACGAIVERFVRWVDFDGYGLFDCGDGGAMICVTWGTRDLCIWGGRMKIVECVCVCHILCVCGAIAFIAFIHSSAHVFPCAQSWSHNWP